MSQIVNFSRRSFLKSSSAFLALPCLDTFAEQKASSLNKKTKMIFLSRGYGFVEKSFYPTKAGRFSDIGLTEGLAPLGKHKNDVSLLGNLVNLGHSSAHEGSLTFLTGAPYSHPYKMRNTVSCDQLAAEYLSEDVRYKSLVLSTDDRNGHGAIAASLSINKKGATIPGINKSLDLYRQLFSSNENTEQIRHRINHKGSILDVVKLDQKNISRRIAKADQEKLQEYFDGVRDIENALKRQTLWLKTPKPQAPFKYPADIDGEMEVKLMFDMIVLAMQTGQTNIATYMMPQASLLRSMGSKLGPHALSHYGHGERLETAKQLDAKKMELLSYLIDKLKSTKDINGQTLYDSTLLAYGTNIRTGHTTRNFPVILSGGAIKNLRLGESLMLPKDTPLQNVWLTLLQEAGIPIDKFSISTGTVPQLLA